MKFSPLVLVLAFLCSGFSLAEGPRVIVLDPGHGGQAGSVKTGSTQESDGASANNATSATLKLLEKDLTLSFCKAIKAEVEKSPEFKDGKWKVVLTRTGDDHLGAMERAAVAVRESADIFLSLHFNATNEHTASGTLAFYVSEDHPKWEYYHFTNPYVKRDQRFSSMISGQVAGALAPLGGQPLKDTIVGDVRDKKDGLRMLGYARSDTHLHNCAISLLEVEFIDNPKVEAWLLKDGGRAKSEAAVAQGVVTGIREWFKLSPADREVVEKARKAPGR